MPYFFIFAGLAVVFVILLMKVLGGKRKTKSQVDQPSTSAAPLTINSASNGDTVSVPGFGDEFDDLDFTVDRRNRYESGNESWFELSGRYRGRRVYIEVKDDDEVAVFINTAQRELTLSDLHLSEDELLQMDENEDHAAGFEWDGDVWRYQYSREIGYFKNGAGDGEGYYNWQFANQDRTRQVSIEKWENEAFQGIVSRCANPRDIRIFRGSA